MDQVQGEAVCWGLPPLAQAPFWWSARAIYRRNEIDLVWDRQGCGGGGSNADRQALGHWLNSEALPWLRHHMRTALDAPASRESREVVYAANGYVLRANPRASCGYLYIVAEPSAAAPCAPSAESGTRLVKRKRSKASKG